MLRITSSLALAATCLGLAGCPSSTTLDQRDTGVVGDTGPRDIPIEQIGARYATTICGLITRCYGETVRDLFIGLGSDAECVTQFTRGYDDGALPLYREAIANGTLRYESSSAEACFDALEASGCGFFTARGPAACDAMLVGTVAAGGACSINEQCIGDAYCANSLACPATCQPRGGAGAACFDDEACQTGLRCGSAGSCVVPALLDAPCQGTGGVDCAGGVICVGEDGATPGICRTPETVFSGALHGACNLINGQFCMPGLSCVVTSFTSMSCEVGDIALGMPCNSALPDACAAGSFCDDTDLAMMDFVGTCAALPGAGLPCATVPFGPSCAPGLHCDANTCRETQSIGGSCVTNQDCYSGYCSGTTCAAGMLCR